MFTQMDRRTLIIGTAVGILPSFFGIVAKPAAAGGFLPFVTNGIFRFGIRMLGGSIGRTAGKAIVSPLIKSNTHRAVRHMSIKGFRRYIIEFSGDAGQTVGKLAAGWLVDKYLKEGFFILSGQDNAGRKCAAIICSERQTPILNEYDVAAIGLTIDLFRHRLAWSRQELFDTFFPIRMAGKSRIDLEKLGHTLVYESASGRVQIEYNTELPNLPIAAITVKYFDNTIEGFTRGNIKLV